MKMLAGLVMFCLLYSSRTSSDQPSPGQRCQGRHLSEEKCCSADSPCLEGEGDCDTDKNDDCAPGLRCGNNNCLTYGTYYHGKDDCCEPDPALALEPPAGQRCRGRNYALTGNGKRCCTPQQPCQEGEGDCDGPWEGGSHDGHEGCLGDLVCGSNNCRQFGFYYHEKDDCCQKNTTVKKIRERGRNPALPLEKPADQRCGGRHYEEKGSCCTVETPCDLGEGDCEPKSDGSVHNDNTDCKPGLVCGSNNCLKFGLYYHAKDDCCDHPKEKLVQQGLCFTLGIGCRK